MDELVPDPWIKGSDDVARVFGVALFWLFALQECCSNPDECTLTNSCPEDLDHFLRRRLRQVSGFDLHTLLTY